MISSIEEWCWHAGVRTRHQYIPQIHSLCQSSEIRETTCVYVSTRCAKCICWQCHKIGHFHLAYFQELLNCRLSLASESMSGLGRRIFCKASYRHNTEKETDTKDKKKTKQTKTKKTDTKRIPTTQGNNYLLPFEWDSFCNAVLRIKIKN